MRVPCCLTVSLSLIVKATGYTFSRLFALAGMVGVSGCFGTWVIPDTSEFDACRTQCIELAYLRVPGCLVRKHPGNAVSTLLSGVADSLDSIELPEGACGCATATIDQGGRFVDVKPVYSWLIDDAGYIVSVIENFQVGQPIPERATCVVGTTVPITFSE